MARITVEDCLDKVDNRFQLVMIAGKRARQLQIEGKEPLLPADKDKPTVIALREIADGLVNVDILNEKPALEMEEDALEAVIPAEVEAEFQVTADPEVLEEDQKNAAQEESTDEESLSPRESKRGRTGHQHYRLPGKPSGLISRARPGQIRTPGFLLRRTGP